MGFNHTGTKLLLFAKERGVNFNKTATIGRQGLHLNEAVLENNLREFGIKNINPADLLKEEYAESFLKILGAQTIHSWDASSYENATIIHDMNLPIAEEHKEQYSVVIDGGSLEHVFNFPVAVKNCMEMVEVGGFFLGITPCNNFVGHGFYQFSPELYFRVFSPENGFKIEKLFFYLDQKNSTWYEVKDPNDVKSRVILSNRYPSNMFVMAKRISNKPIFSAYPQQSDYQHLMWEGKGEINQIKKNQGKVTLFYKVKRKVSQLLSLFNDIGDGNGDFFIKNKR